MDTLSTVLLKNVGPDILIISNFFIFFFTKKEADRICLPSDDYLHANFCIFFGLVLKSLLKPLLCENIVL